MVFVSVTSGNRFQFLCGAIKRFGMVFNPRAANGFQFLCGAIKSLLGEDLLFKPQMNFNSCVVRLRDKQLRSPGNLCIISIPVWCD